MVRGEVTDAEVLFWADEARIHATAGARFELWYGRPVGQGTVTALAVPGAPTPHGRAGPGSYCPAMSACSRTRPLADSTCLQAAPVSALAALVHLTVRSRFIFTSRSTNST